MSASIQPGIKRVEISCTGLNPIAWLASQTNEPRYYWSSRDGTMERAGAGCIDRIQGKSLNDLPEAFRVMRQRLKGADAKYFGGVAFNDRCCGQEWEGFGAYEFILPKAEIIRANGQTVLAVYTREGEEDIEFWKASLNPHAVVDEHYRFVSKFENPGFEIWEKTLDHVFDDFERQIYQKIVLARCMECRMDKAVDPLVILQRLKTSNINSHVFAWMPQAGRAFLGVTPERLYKRSGRKIESEAVAGTMPRGRDAQEDLSFEKDLLSSLKNESEHRFVVEYILKVFRQLCREYFYDKTIHLLKLSDNQHLLTKFQGLLKDDVSDEMIIRSLHPTPAVGGYPRESAAAKILSYEAINRGWFTGLIGSVGIEETELAVAIRSGLIRDDKVYLYAGAGIVEGSEAQDEWKEVEGKMKGWMKVLQE